MVSEGIELKYDLSLCLSLLTLMYYLLVVNSMECYANRVCVCVRVEIKWYVNRGTMQPAVKVKYCMGFWQEIKLKGCV